MTQSSYTDAVLVSSPTFADRLRAFQDLAKSGIVTLILLSVFAGYLIGHPHEIPFSAGRLLATLIGLLLLSSGSSALNQIQERHIDGRMKRTQNRPLPSGKISLKDALFFTWATVISGTITLTALDPLLGFLGCLAVLSYNGLYTLWWKRRWARAAIPGAIPGALPILMGYYAASRNITDPAGWYLFAILFFWQMPHFWVLALKYQEDYAQGSFPTLPVAKGPVTTIQQITLWGICYVGLALMAPFFLKVEWLYLFPSLAVSAVVMLELFRFYRSPDGKAWLRFFLWINFSLVLYLAFAVIDRWAIYLVPVIWG
jgi:protoheme IX farnesyltransferase